MSSSIVGPFQQVSGLLRNAAREGFEKEAGESLCGHFGFPPTNGVGCRSPAEQEFENQVGVKGRGWVHCENGARLNVEVGGPYPCGCKKGDAKGLKPDQLDIGLGPEDGDLKGLQEGLEPLQSEAGRLELCVGQSDGNEGKS